MPQDTLAHTQTLDQQHHKDTQCRREHLVGQHANTPGDFLVEGNRLMSPIIGAQGLGCSILRHSFYRYYWLLLLLNQLPSSIGEALS